MTLIIPDDTTFIGMALGPDIGLSGNGAANKAALAMDAFLGWRLDMLTDYKYPHIAGSKTRYMQYQGCTRPINWNQFLIPQDANPADVLAGKLDSVYKQDAQDMIDAGRTNDFISPGYEGNGNNFPGSAGIVGDDMYRQLFQHVVSLYRSVPGWNCNVLWNYTVVQALASGLNPVKAFPGNDFVDGVAFDNYEKGGYYPWAADPSKDHAKSWASENLPKWQGQWRFGYDRGLRTYATECGLFSGDHGGGDNRYWLDAVAQELQKGEYAAFCYYNAAGGSAESSRLFAYANGVYSPIATGAFPYPNASPVFPQVFSPTALPRISIRLPTADAAKVSLLQSQLATALDQLSAAETASQSAIEAMDAAETQLDTIRTAWNAWPMVTVMK